MRYMATYTVYILQPSNFIYLKLSEHFDFQVARVSYNPLRVTLVIR